MEAGGLTSAGWVIGLNIPSESSLNEQHFQLSWIKYKRIIMSRYI